MLAYAPHAIYDVNVTSSLHSDAVLLHHESRFSFFRCL